MRAAPVDFPCGAAQAPQERRTLLHDRTMTETLTPSSITYTSEIAACSSYGLESSFGRSRDYVFRGTKLSAHQPVDPEAGTPEGGSMSELVMLTNVDETLPEVRTRIRRELDAVVRTADALDVAESRAGADQPPLTRSDDGVRDGQRGTDSSLLS